MNAGLKACKEQHRVPMHEAWPDLQVETCLLPHPAGTALRTFAAYIL